MLAVNNYFFLFACGLRAHPPTIPACELALTILGFKDNDQSLCYVGEDLIKYNYTIPNVPRFAPYVIVLSLTVIND